mmetsp:Transcript_26091/g.83944  ORF Transcript_26091/g.83944 Transcript_26091/m.83944 type:complete len:239 (+) Transcript_26091:1779-2495(+)
MRTPAARNSSSEAGSLSWPQANLMNLRLCSCVNPSSTRQKNCTWRDSGVRPPLYCVCRRSSARSTSALPHTRRSSSPHEHRPISEAGTSRLSPARSARSCARLSSSRCSSAHDAHCSRSSYCTRGASASTPPPPTLDALAPPASANTRDRSLRITDHVSVPANLSSHSSRLHATTASIRPRPVAASAATRSCEDTGCPASARHTADGHCSVSSTRVRSATPISTPSARHCRSAVGALA